MQALLEACDTTRKLADTFCLCHHSRCLSHVSVKHMGGKPSEVRLKSYSTDACIQDAERRLGIMLVRAENYSKKAQVSIDAVVDVLHACSG